MAGFLLLIIAFGVVRSLLAIGVSLTLAIALAVVARVPWRWYLLRIAPVLLFLAFFALPLPFLYRGDVLWSWGPLAVSERGLELALVVIGKSLALVTLVLVVLATAPLHTTARAAQCLGIPRLIIHLTLLSYRYVFLLVEELLRLRIAVRVRGFRSRPSKHTYRTIAHLSGALLVRGSDRADRIHHAMRTRGFEGEYRSLTAFRTRWSDVVGFGVLVLLAVSVGVLEWV